MTPGPHFLGKDEPGGGQGPRCSREVDSLIHGTHRRHTHAHTHTPGRPAEAHSPQPFDPGAGLRKVVPEDP